MSERVRLVHWNDVEAAACAARLVTAGYGVDARRMDQAGLKALRADPPVAVVIDLSRMPSHGRDIGLALGQFKATRVVPLVFVDGDEDKVERIRPLLPDATYTTWSRIRSALKRARAHPPSRPGVATSPMSAYSGTPLPKKLGIKPGHTVAIVGAPMGFERTFAPLPDGVVVRRRPRGARDVTLWFVKDSRTLTKGMTEMVPFGERGGLWILWPKRMSGVKTDVTQADIRQVGMAAGLVDFKICAVDQTWSGLRFSRRPRQTTDGTAVASD